MSRSNCPGGGLYVVEGEVSLLMTAMRRGVRWSTHSHQDEDQDVLMKGLATLKEELNDVKHLSDIEPGAFIAPLLEIIRSEETTGPVTSLALSAVNKIISYGLIDPEHPAIVPCVEAIADAVTHARFVGTDASGDGVVLMRILHVLRALVLSPPGDNLSNESICEIMLSCFRICFETRLSELLRRTAEHCLRDMVQHLFVRLPQFVDDARGLLSMKKMRTGSMENTKSKTKKSKNFNFKPKPIKPSTDEIDYSEAQLLSPVERVKINHLATTPITPAGNIVDMQGLLNQVTPEKARDDKCDRSNTAKSETNKNDSNKECPNGESKCEGENKVSEDGNVLPSPSIESKPIEGQPETKQVPDPIPKSPVPENQDNQTVDEKYNQYAQSPMGSVEDLSVDDASSVKVPTVKVDGEPIDEYVNSQGITFTAVQQHTPYGSLCIRELFRFLVSLCSPLDKQNSEIMMHLGLSLLQVTLEVAADSLSNFPSLLALIKDDLARNLILLLGTDRVSILAADLQVSYLLFEAQREHLKFQMEQFIVKLMDIVNSDSNKITYDQRELALEAICRLWKIPGLPAELFINYDCGSYSINLYEELMKMLSKVLYNNASAAVGNWFSIQFISLDAIFALIAGMEARGPKRKDCADLLKISRHSASMNLPNKEDLLETKTRKRWLAIGSEKFNESPREGIAKLTEHELLGGTPGHPDPDEIAKLLRENPTLEKKAIGEYLSKKENTNILHSFVRSFNLQNTRMDLAVRQYLEAFRLPGEAPLISLLLEKFAEHWHDSNNRPFASADAAFTLAYAIIMLNVDQHNHNVKRQNIPMTTEDFKKNLRRVNGGEDFDQDMLDEIYNAIKTEEIVMPAEHTGLVKENYLWKCLLRRGVSPESAYTRIGNSGEFIDKELAERAWAPIVSALCRAYDKAPDRAFQKRVAEKLESCAAISAHYSMTSDLDTLIVSLCKFTGLAVGCQPEQVVLKLGGSGTCQLASRTLFRICHMYGNALRASWKNLVDCLQMLFRAKLLPENLSEGEDFLEPSGKVTLIRESSTPKTVPAEQGLLSSLYSYIASDTSRTPHPAEAVAKKRAKDFIARHCFLKQIIEESKFLEEESLRCLVASLVLANSGDEGTSVFLLEQLLDVTIKNRDRVNCIWPVVQSHLDGILATAARENQSHLLERVTVGMLRLAIRLLRSEDFAGTVLPPLSPLAHLPSAGTPPLCRQIAYGLHNLINIGAANIHSTEDWKVVFNLLECSGAGALQPKQIVGNAVLDEANSSPNLDLRPVSPVPEWVLVSPTGTEAPLPVAADTIVLDRELLPHDPAALVKCCEILEFLVKDVAHLTPFNFELCVQCVRTFAEAVLFPAGKRPRIHATVNAEELASYQKVPIDLLELMYKLYAETEEVFKWWAKEGNGDDAVSSESKEVIATGSLWPKAFQPLLQGIARLCCDSRRGVRAAAIISLQKTLLDPDLYQPSALEWSQCLEQVLFPLLAQLLNPIAVNDPLAVEETRVRSAMLLSKVFLQHLNPLLTLPGFLPLWLTVLDLLRAYMHADNSENLYEAIPESLKNMLLVMASAGVLQPESFLWTPTWRAIDAFLPNLKAELFPEPPPPPPTPSPPESQSPTDQSQPQLSAPQSQSPSHQSQPVTPSVQQSQSMVTSLVDQREMSSYPKAIILPHPEDSCSRPASQSLPSDASFLSNSPAESHKVNVPIALDSVKEPQQIVTLVSQPLPSVASPVTVQPPTQQIYMPQQPQQPAYPIEVNASEQQKQSVAHQIVSIKETSSPTKHQYAHLPQMQEFRSGLYADTVETAANSANQVDIPTTGTATIFNSAAYFSEDSTADRLFVVTNP